MVQRKKLKGNDIAVFFGTFACFHVGHLTEVQLAKREHDGVVVIVSGRKGDRGELTDLGLNKRFRYVRELFADDPLVNVAKLDETDLPAYPNGWEPWLDELEKDVKASIENQDAMITVYTGEKEYDDKLHELRPNWKTHLMDRRSLVDIHATQIRENPYRYFNYITDPFKRHFTKKVLIAGSASTGKTTLAQDLGKLYHAPVSLEYAREYQDKYNVADEELDVKDYMYLFSGQWEQTSNLIDSKENHGLVIADTNSTVTMAYVDYYLKDKISDEDYQMLHDNYIQLLKREEWDLILFTVPHNDYVDDGFRDMNMADKQTRDSFTQHMLDSFKEAGLADKIIMLDNAEHMYRDNYLQAIKVIQTNLQIGIGEI